MSKFLSEMKAPRGAVKNRKRIGRGDGSGHGGTATRGHKGQKARAGGYHKVGFEGGQMPLARRLPKRGFNNIFKKQYATVNVGDLSDIPEGTKVNLAYLKEQGKVKQARDGLKILGGGELTKSLTVVAHKFTKSSQEKIKQAGGSAELVASKATN